MRMITSSEPTENIFIYSFSARMVLAVIKAITATEPVAFPTEALLVGSGTTVKQAIAATKTKVVFLRMDFHAARSISATTGRRAAVISVVVYQDSRVEGMVIATSVLESCHLRLQQVPQKNSRLSPVSSLPPPLLPQQSQRQNSALPSSPLQHLPLRPRHSPRYTSECTRNKRCGHSKYLQRVEQAREREYGSIDICQANREREKQDSQPSWMRNRKV
ncbi:uncharacterized protein EI90DRAFT_2599735 [Cantharellus anzutake]|uniref:uncharacterized protein n=1 Tax=Cantharellus anzutake TaxID=1750568 RepID=UPI00190402FA|nr:uncharacterized protein EI90DRAFT_2599735 [Cantharellus anzutake]KAF8320550.1 hypothetical protein EI90DRAFT_2599735 [Cantharellus anzutake]